MNFEKFNLTEMTHAEELQLGEGVEIWSYEGEHEFQCVNMYGAERTLVLSVADYVLDEQYGEWRSRVKYWLMTLS